MGSKRVRSQGRVGAASGVRVCEARGWGKKGGGGLQHGCKWGKGVGWTGNGEGARMHSMGRCCKWGKGCGLQESGMAREGRTSWGLRGGWLQIGYG